MPGMDGLTVIEEARRLNADLSVIIIAEFSTEASAIEAANLGVSGYLTKPFKVPKVLAVAARALFVDAAAKALIGTTVDDAAMEVLAAAASAAATPIDDKRGTVEFRTEVAGVLAQRAAAIALERAKS